MEADDGGTPAHHAAAAGRTGVCASCPRWEKSAVCCHDQSICVHVVKAGRSPALPRGALPACALPPGRLPLSDCSPPPLCIPPEALKFLASKSLSHMVARDVDGWTPAHAASYYGRTEVTKRVCRRESLGL